MKLVNMCTIYNITKYILQWMGPGRSAVPTCRDSVTLSKRARLPALSSWADTGAQSHAMGPATGSQIDWIDIKEGKLQLWSQVLETLIQEERVGSKETNGD